MTAAERRGYVRALRTVARMARRSMAEWDPECNVDVNTSETSRTIAVAHWCEANIIARYCERRAREVERDAE
jgi:predicted signal transduction protein with EAL and GGDEF domain